MEGSPIQLLITRICGTKRDERAKTVWHNVMNTRQTLPHIHAFQHLAFIHWVLFTHTWGFPVTSQTYTPTTTQSQDLIQILKPARHDCRSLEQERESAPTVGIPSPWPSGRGVLVQRAARGSTGGGDEVCLGATRVSTGGGAAVVAVTPRWLGSGGESGLASTPT